MRLSFVSTLLCAVSEAFVPRQTPRFPITIPDVLFSSQANVRISVTNTIISDSDVSSSTILCAKKRKGNAKAAALDTLDALENQFDLNEPLSRKEQKQLSKKKKKDATKAVANDETDFDGRAKQKSKSELLVDSSSVSGNNKQMNKKEKMLAKALASEALDAEPNGSSLNNGGPQFSKNEQKALKNKKEKMAKKKVEKIGAKNGIGEQQKGFTQCAADDTDGLEQKVGIEQQQEEALPPKSSKPTIEDKIRKNRPPPRVRIMESAQPGFVSLRMQNVGMTFRNQEVLKDVTWGVQSGDRIGLIGKNGAGKTTQLRILANELEPTTGDVVKSSMDLRTAMLRQEFVDELVKERTLKEEFMNVFEKEMKIFQDLEDTDIKLEHMAGSDPEEMQEILNNMQELQQKAEDKDVFILESKVKKVMGLMGFKDEESDDLVASFSGGWKMRIGLGKVLLKEPNVLLLDEPTNHLDLESVEWMEAFLREQNIPMIIVSHDREFLDQVCTKIVDAEGGICTEYDGNYSRFLKLKKARMKSWQAAYDAQEKKIKSERQWMDKFQAKQPQIVKQRKEKLEKFLISDEYVQKPPFTGKPFRFRFPDAPRLSPEVAEIEDMSHSYKNEISNNQLFDHVDLFIEKGDRIAIVGPNGSGKSTLLRLLTGKETPNEGNAKIVGANVEIAYFEQNQADSLNLDKTVIQTIQGASTDQAYGELRALLGQFLFKGDDVEKKVEFLSGGEKARLSLCCMMLRPANLLILDEPTNHLDIPAKEMLEEALQHFNGSILVVSHDRYFVSKVATSIVAIEDKKLTKYLGDYKFYMEKSKMNEKIEARYIKGLDQIRAAPVINLEMLAKPKRNFGGGKNSHMVTRKDKGVKNAKRMRNK